jgi:uncharacterized membrane protein
MAFDAPGHHAQRQLHDSAGHLAPRRRGYLDWLRGLAVLIMIEAHLLDSWTRSPDREMPEFGVAMIVGGMGAPLFLFLAGVAVSMSAGAKFRRGGDARRASAAVVKRGFEIFGLAFLFRVQAWILGWSSPRALLKVDILNIMGPAIAAAAALWGAATTARGKYLAFAGATIAIAFLTPVIRGAAILAALPDPVEAYLRPVAGLSNFVFLPWAAFVFAGAVVGQAIDGTTTDRHERTTNLVLGAAGAAIAGVAYALSHVRNPLFDSYFWTTSPAFFFMRTGAMTFTIALAYAWESRPGGADAWSPFKQLGRTSLFIYWIHIEMVYGLISLPLHRSLTWIQAWVAYALFVLFMLACAIVKDYVVTAWRNRQRQAAATA